MTRCLSPPWMTQLLIHFPMSHHYLKWDCCLLLTLEASMAIRALIPPHLSRVKHLLDRYKAWMVSLPRRYLFLFLVCFHALQEARLANSVETPAAIEHWRCFSDWALEVIHSIYLGNQLHFLIGEKPRYGLTNLAN